MENSKKAIVIGSGFGGIAAAIRLQARGYQTQLLEMRDKPGGRGYVFEENGFKFDAGPTIITAPFLIDELFALAGKKTNDYVQIVPTDPFYRIRFSDGREFNYTSDHQKMEDEIRKFNPDDVAGYNRFVKITERIFKRAFIDLADKPFLSIWDMIKVAPDLIRLSSHESVYKLVTRHFKSEELRQVFSFHPLLVGGNPYQSSSIYGMIHYLERKWGVHFAMGGTGALINALIRLFEEMGGELKLNSRVDKIIIEDQIARGVLLNGKRINADLIVSNADTANTYRKLIDAAYRPSWTNKRVEKMRYSMGLFLIYFGTDRTYPDLAHHTILLGPRYKGLLEDIFTKKILAPDFSLYLHAPTRTDASLAPEGHECFYVLSPVPNLQGEIDWEKEKERYADQILESLEKICPDLRRHIVSQRIFTPLDFEKELDAYVGSAFQFEPILTQSAWFRPHNKAEDIEGLYFVGAGTHPGAGVPGVLSSAKALESILP